MKVNPNSNIPLYKQVLSHLNQKIADGVWQPGDKLPAETTFMEEYGVSRITMRAAIAELVEEGILVRTQGKGTFVAQPKSMYKANDHFGFTRSCILAGKKPTTKLISAEIIFPTLQDIEFLGVKETEQIIATTRLRLVDDEPTMIEVNHYTQNFTFLLNENMEGSLFELLGNKYNIYVAESIRTLEICYSTKSEADLLDIKANTPLLLFKDKQKDAAGNPMFISRQVYCTDKLKFYL